MNNRFRRIFFPTEEEIKAERERLEKFVAEAKTKPKPNLIEDPTDKRLMKSEPFQHFYGDCTWCKNYVDGPGVTEGGFCEKRGLNCGWGFTCPEIELIK